MSAVGMPGFTETEIGWIPTDWLIQSVASLANVDSESLSNKTAADFTFRYISLGDVDAGKLIGGHSLITFAEAPSRARRIVKSGDILFATVRPTLKGHFFARRVDGNVVASTGFAVIRAKADVASPAFLYQSLLSGNVDAQIEKLTVGSNYPAVNSADVKGLLLPAPPLPEQQKIAAILTAVDDKLDVIARQIEATQTLKQGLMQTLFSRGVGTQDADGRWVPHSEFKDCELGTIPAGWGVSSIGSLFEIVERAVKMADEQSYRRVTVRRRYGGIELRDELRGGDIKVKSQFALEAGDFLISERQIVHGACGIVPKGLAGALVSNEYLVLKARPAVDVRYFNYLVQQLKYAKYFMLCSQGVDIEKFLFKPKDWLKKPVPVPPVAEQARIADVLATTDEKLNALRAKLDELQQVKRGLMQKLLTGEWRVSVDATATGT
jgi:type I restriction enzyme, S subunit